MRRQVYELYQSQEEVVELVPEARHPLGDWTYRLSR